MPINGIEGVMGLAVVETALEEYSAVYYLNTLYQFPIEYMQFVSNTTDEFSHVKGYLSFSET